MWSILRKRLNDCEDLPLLNTKARRTPLTVRTHLCKAEPRSSHFSTKLIEPYEIYYFLRESILSNALAVDLEQVDGADGLGGEPF